MSLASGDRIGHYEILSLAGAGGMGEVYRARDTKLKRDVALKVLPESFSRDPERWGRFQREAEILASLNHPNIATVHGLEEGALVMEFVEGPTLPCPQPVESAIRYAKQIAEALEYAHERGVVHRDLKPANVKITPEGSVKLLDFGLAKAIDDREGRPEDPANSPTLTLGHTRAGVILGTAAYMSPEQAAGYPADRRADIFSFGTVLYEMLAGERAFTGNSAAETLASVLKVEPDWSRLPSSTPAAVRRLIERCLTKDRKQRLQAIGEARITLENPGTREAAPAKPASRWAWIAATVVLAVIAGALFIGRSGDAAAPAELVKFEVPLPPNATPTAAGTFAMSPDGRHLVFSAVDAQGVPRLWLRNLNETEARLLPGIEIAVNTPPVIWSPDSRAFAYSAGGKLRSFDWEAGVSQTICDLSEQAVGGDWTRDGLILFGATRGLMSVPASGGAPAPVTEAAKAVRETNHAFPVFLPDGRHFLYLRLRGRDVESSGIYVGTLDAKPADQEMTLLLPTTFAAQFVPLGEGPGRLLFVRDGNLMAQEFDPEQRKLTGSAQTLVEGIGSYSADGYFSAAGTSALAYRSGEASTGTNSPMVWVDRQGKAIGTVGQASQYGTLKVSPDGTRVAASRPDGDIWVVDLARGIGMRLRSDEGNDGSPVWSPDGKRIAYGSARGGVRDLYVRDSNGAAAEDLILKSDQDKNPVSWSSDGRYLFYDLEADPKTRVRQVWAIPMEGADRKPFPIAQADFNQAAPRISPDGRWIAYVSAETGRGEIYVRPFQPPTGAVVKPGKWIISEGGGSQARWRGDGKELFYLGQDGKVMAVDVFPGPEFRAGTPKALFDFPPGNQIWDVARDGSRFLFPRPISQVAPAPITVVLNWSGLLKK